jgi:hypothetical protein
MRSFLFIRNIILKGDIMACRGKRIKLILFFVVIAILLFIPLYNISNINKIKIKDDFASEVKNILTSIENEKMKVINFNFQKINERTIDSILGISNTNYEQIRVNMIAEKIRITVIGCNKWKGMLACGTIEGIKIIEGTDKCV